MALTDIVFYESDSNTLESNIPADILNKPLDVTADIFMSNIIFLGGVYTAYVT